MWLVWIFRAFTLYMIYGPCRSDPLMGPAVLVIKHTEKCRWTLPTFIEFEFQCYQRKSEVVFSLNTTLPYKLSDDYGFEVNVAVKRNGGWRPNFFKYKGKNACTIIKTIQYELFELIGKGLNAPNPPTCPLPKGFVSLNYTPDSKKFQETTGTGVMPYGEFRVHTNITYQEDVVACFRLFVEMTPKKTKSKG